jgi:aspartyl-tRNA(Asn)/glutamyl-tRNA(Gln) amidotransferase subunit B
MKTYTPTIGLEVHAELKTNTKMFCSSKNDPHYGKPNAHVCPICMGHPGTLPVINKAAVKHVLKVGLALKSELATYTEFDRKNYFYPDIPKGYQITQYLYPLVKGGSLNGVEITRVHLEEDTARSLHDQGEGSIIDYNRAGVPLMELVTEPVMHDAKTAGNFARELQLLLRTLGVSDANMEKGEMRVEANISVSDTDMYGTKVEVKNLNSFRSVEGAIEFEIKRQIEALEKGEKLVQETRGWDEVKCKTFSQRVKETAHDYRYFPEPDLPKLQIGDVPEFSLSRLTAEMPLLPSEKREKYSNLGIAREQVEIIISNIEIDRFFSEVSELLNNDTDLSRLSANYILTDVLPALIDKRIEDAQPAHFSKLMQLVKNETINSRVAKNLLLEVIFGDTDPEEIVVRRGLAQNHSADSLGTVVQQILDENTSVVLEYKAGKETALQYLVGQAMKQSKGAANPKMLLELFKSTIG